MLGYYGHDQHSNSSTCRTVLMYVSRTVLMYNCSYHNLNLTIKMKVLKNPILNHLWFYNVEQNQGFMAEYGKT